MGISDSVNCFPLSAVAPFYAFFALLRSFRSLTSSLLLCLQGGADEDGWLHFMAFAAVHYPRRAASGSSLHHLIKSSKFTTRGGDDVGAFEPALTAFEVIKWLTRIDSIQRDTERKAAPLERVFRHKFYFLQSRTTNIR